MKDADIGKSIIHVYFSSESRILRRARGYTHIYTLEALEHKQIRSFQKVGQNTTKAPSTATGHERAYL